jgi:hypothetical protein
MNFSLLGKARFPKVLSCSYLIGTMTWLFFRLKLNKLFILPVPEILVVDVVGAYRIMFRSSRILFFLLKFRFFLPSNPPR